MTQFRRDLISLTTTPSGGRLRIALAAGALLFGVAAPAYADDPPPPAVAAPAAVPEAAASVPPPPPTDKPPAAPPEVFPPISVSAWGRLGLVLQGSDPSGLDGLSENGEVDLIMGGKIHKNFSFVADFVATFGPTGPTGGAITGAVGIMDLVGQIEVNDLLNVWVGRMLVPSDRSNFSGPWFMAPWNYPGFYNPFGAPIGPRQGPSGRNDGFTIWGQVPGGMVKYYVGAFDLFDVAQSPLITGRINLALKDPEPGYLHSSSYYGKEMLNLGVGAQFKKNGSGGSNYGEINADLLYEHTINRGVLDLEGAFYGYFGDAEPVSTSFFVLASYVVPDPVGIGRLQPLVRFQGATPKGGGDFASIIEAQLGYIVNPYATRLALLYQHIELAGQGSNAVILGLQLQK